MLSGWACFCATDSVGLGIGSSGHRPPSNALLLINPEFQSANWGLLVLVKICFLSYLLSRVTQPAFQNSGAFARTGRRPFVS
jgi:hypothetical protein